MAGTIDSKSVAALEAKPPDKINTPPQKAREEDSGTCIMNGQRQKLAFATNIHHRPAVQNHTNSVSTTAFKVITVSSLLRRKMERLEVWRAII